MARTYDINGKAEEILKIAEEYGVEKNFLFITTFKRYTTQLKILTELEKEIADNGTTVKKEYVKGRKNIYISPALKEYNNVVNSSNKTVSTLMNIIKSNSDTYSDDTVEDPLLKALNGDGEDEE